MTISELLDAAKRKQGSLGAIAQQFGFAQSRLSAWRSGARKPDAGEIMMLAEMAGLPPFETLAKIEQELDQKHQSVWARALGNLRAAGVAATVILGLSIYSMTPRNASAAVTNFVTPSPAEARPALNKGSMSVGIMSTPRRAIRRKLQAPIPDGLRDACPLVAVRASYRRRADAFRRSSTVTTPDHETHPARARANHCGHPAAL